jgi:phage baseplate assembly protein W
MPLYGPKWPLKKGNDDTYELYGDLKSQINYNLKSILLTTPGENISDPAYGVGLRFFLFELNNEIVQDELGSLIEQQISFYLPDITLIDVSLDTDEDLIDKNNLSIKIKYELKGKLNEFLLELKDVSTIGFA